MKYFFLICFISIAYIGKIFAQDLPFSINSKHIKEFSLDEHNVYNVPIAVDAPTTIMFPSSFTALQAVNISANPEVLAPVMLEYTPGQYFFTVRATRDDANAMLNIIWQRKTYVLRLIASKEPYYSVTFGGSGGGGMPLGGSARRKRVSPQNLLGLLDKAKSFRLLSTQYPQMLEQANRIEPQKWTVYKNFDIWTDEIIRFDDQDTLVFRILLRNNSNKTIYYSPQGFAVRTGNRVYHQSISDASGIMPPKSTTLAYFAITGSGDGGRNDLSVKNDFNIIVTRMNANAVELLR
ncbi:MAG: hypothetical protein K1X66_04760 [Verrucomicrobiae bacterium]|nr:hypothetical protein [Verrucomicrobiae bacterium]